MLFRFETYFDRNRGKVRMYVVLEGGVRRSGQTRKNNMKDLLLNEVCSMRVV